MKGPPGYDIGDGNCLSVLKCIYGLVQAPCQYYMLCREVYQKAGMKQLQTDECVLTRYVSTHRVHIDRNLFTESPSFLRFFPDWATPVKLCSLSILIDCRLHLFLSLIQKGIRMSYQVHLINELKIRWLMCVFACWLSCFLLAGLTIFVKRCCTISRTSFSSSLFTSRSFTFVIKLRENPTCYLLPVFCCISPIGLQMISSCFRPLLMSRHWTPCRLTFPCLSQLETS